MNKSIVCLDFLTKTIPAPKHWQFCIGSGHAHLAHRFDYIEQLEYCVKELGFKSVRFHGVFSDDMNVVTTLIDLVGQNSKNSSREYNFYQIGVIFDKFLKIGVKPFVELSFMPSALAKKNKTIFNYKANVSLPKYIEEWKILVSDFAKYLIDRYGIKEVSSWNFEVWNEPNLRYFFDGSQRDYFNFYKETCLSLKSVDSAIRVGGPSTANNAWIKEFVAFCATSGTPLDFISTHQYPSDALGHDFKTKNLLTIQMDRSRKIIASVHKPIQSLSYDERCFSSWTKGEMTKQCQSVRKIAKNLPLYYTEWNIDSNCMASIHDRIETASFIIKTCLENQNLIDGSSFWTFSDIFEEVFFFPEPFSGGFGLLNIHGIPKPSFWAFKFLSELGSERFELKKSDMIAECACFKNGDSLQIIVWCQEFVTSTDSTEMNFVIENCPKYKKAEMKEISHSSGNPIQIWKDMQCPKALSEHDVADIIKKSAVAGANFAFCQQNNQLTFDLQIKSNEIKIITLF